MQIPLISLRSSLKPREWKARSKGKSEFSGIQKKSNCLSRRVRISP